MPIDPETKKILDNRLASGEIDKEKYRELLAALSGNDPVEEPKTTDPDGLSSDPATPTIDAPDPMSSEEIHARIVNLGAWAVIIACIVLGWLILNLLLWGRIGDGVFSEIFLFAGCASLAYIAFHWTAQKVGGFVERISDTCVYPPVILSLIVGGLFFVAVPRVCRAF